MNVSNPSCSNSRMALLHVIRACPNSRLSVVSDGTGCPGTIASQDLPAQSRRHPDIRSRVSLTQINRLIHGAPPLADEAC